MWIKAIIDKVFPDLWAAKFTITTHFLLGAQLINDVDQVGHHG